MFKPKKQEKREEKPMPTEDNSRLAALEAKIAGMAPPEPTLVQCEMSGDTVEVPANFGPVATLTSTGRRVIHNWSNLAVSSTSEESILDAAVAYLLHCPSTVVGAGSLIQPYYVSGIKWAEINIDQLARAFDEYMSQHPGGKFIAAPGFEELEYHSKSYGMLFVPNEKVVNKSDLRAATPNEVANNELKLKLEQKRRAAVVENSRRKGVEEEISRLKASL